MAANNKKLFFPIQDQTEKVLFVIRRHWFTYCVLWALALILLLPAFAGFVYWTSVQSDFSAVLNAAIAASLSAYTLLIFAMMIYGFIDYYLDVYIITDKRIVDIRQNGFFKRAISELSLRQIQDVKAEVNGIFATLFHYGSVQIQTAAEQENFLFKSIPHPYVISKKILDLHNSFLKNDGDKTAAEDSFTEKNNAVKKNSSSAESVSNKEQSENTAMTTLDNDSPKEKQAENVIAPVVSASTPASANSPSVVIPQIDEQTQAKVLQCIEEHKAAVQEGALKEGEQIDLS